jgi:hypothetical protein
MRTVVGMVLMLVGVSTTLMAGSGTPEIDASTGVAAIAILSGGILVLRGRRKK